MVIIHNQEQLAQALSVLISTDSPISIDTETNMTESYAERFCLGVSIAQEDNYWYIPVGHRNTILGPQENIDFLPPEFFEKLKHHTIIMHNAKFDLEVLYRLGFTDRFETIFDTMLMHHYIDENSEFKQHDLEYLSKKYCSVPKNAALQKALKIDWDNSLIHPMAKYAQEDAIATLQLYSVLDQWFEPYRDAWFDYDKEFMYLLMKMEMKGIRLDKSECAKNEKLCRARMAEIKKEVGWDIGSTNLLIEKLFRESPKGFGLRPLSHTPGGKPQINTDFLEKTNHPICGLILEYRRCQKMASSYFENYLTLVGQGDRLYPSFKQFGTVTGRLSCENPNLQQVPRDSDVKKMFLPDEGLQLWEIDFRNLEMRMAAVYSNCHPLLEVFENEGDVHQTVADRLGISRQVSKIVNFLLIYGGGAEALSFQAKIPISKAKGIYSDYRKQYPELFHHMDKCTAIAESKGEIRLFSGRRRHFKYQSECRKAFNSVIQGGAFELVKRGMLHLEKAGVDMRNQVHDSVWINAHNEGEVQEAAHIMSDWTKEAFGLHFSVDIKRLR